MYSEDFVNNMMERAIELSKKGRGNVSPNPLVGCVIVKGNTIIGEGFHEKFGSNHAEKNAIENCSENPLGAVAFVTLEPCCIDSKTPPCTDLLIDSGIDSVYIGTKDPNPDVNGKGIEILKKNGINVYCGFLENNIKKLNKSFFKWVRYGLPWVTVKIAQDSKGFMGKDNNSQIWITNKESQKNSHYLRSKVDAVLIGTQTAKVDNPSLTVREVVGVNPKRIVIDTNRTLPLDLKIYVDDEVNNLVFCSTEKFKKNSVKNTKFIPVKEVNGLLDFNEIFAKVANEGITSVLVESGPKIISSLDCLNIIDELYIYTSENEIKDATLRNPIVINNNWKLKNSIMLGSDELQVYEKEILCSQE
tara:strand:+ start:9830 stop:10909 length:1080 start_codon:yes stop_codon:yes gene_type:complete